MADVPPGQKALILFGLAVIFLALLVLTLGQWQRSRTTIVQYAPPPTPPTPQTIAVHIVGAVQRPGLYWLSPGARVADAIAQAGGLLPTADPASVNLAAIVEDGQQINVRFQRPTPAIAEEKIPPEGKAGVALPTPSRPSPSPAAPPASPSARSSSATLELTPIQPISLTKATKQQLETLPGIGPQLAAEIIYYRTLHGPFRNVDELLHVPGFGPSRLEKIRPYVVP